MIEPELSLPISRMTSWANNEQRNIEMDYGLTVGLDVGRYSKLGFVI